MSFDIAIVPKEPFEKWDEILDRIEAEADSKLSPERLSAWEHVVERLAAEDAFDVLRSDERIEINLTGAGIQVSLYERGVAINYGEEGAPRPDAIDLTTKIVAEVRKETGWAVFDPHDGAEIERPEDLLPHLGAIPRMSLDRERLVVPFQPPWWRFWERSSGRRPTR